MAAERYPGTRRYLRAHWPGYAAAYATLVIVLLGLALCIANGWLALSFLLLLATAVLLYFLIASLRAILLVRDRRDNDIARNLFIMSQARPDDHLAAVDLGEHHAALSIASRLTTGQLVVFDVYHPQRTPDRPLIRLRRDAPHPVNDPRLEWYDCSISLLPLPDNSVTAVFLPEILTWFAERGDHPILLRELHRILRPEGQLLLAERTRTRANLLAFGPAALRLQPASTWHTLLTESGFEIRTTKHPHDLIHFIRAQKPSPDAGKQLPLDLLFAPLATGHAKRRQAHPRS